jgi:hypothetical protein
MDRDAEKVTTLLTSLASAADTGSAPLAALLEALADHDYDVTAAFAELRHDD